MTFQNGSMGLMAVFSCVAGIAGVLLAQDALAIEFVRKPVVVHGQTGTTISFEVSKSTDVEVAIVDAGGKTVRHLGAGVLGPNSPEPFKKGLSQQIAWDRKDDLGKPVGTTAGLKVRVSLELQARLHRIIGWSGQNVDAPQGIACGPDGTLYIAFGQNLTAHAFSTVVCAYDREGKYLRQVIPARPDLPAEQRKGWPRMKVEGLGEIPIVHHVLSRSTYPAFSVDYRCFPAAAPDGSLLVINAGNSKVKHPDTGGGRRLLVVGGDGSVPADYMSRKLPEDASRGAGHVAVSPDGKFAYVSGFSEKKKGSCNVVWKVGLGAPGKPEVFAGRLFKKAETKSDLDSPAGLDVDAKGNVYVADRANKRIAVYGSDGGFLDELPLENAYLVKVSRRSGAVYATIVKPGKKLSTTKIVKLGGLEDKAVKAGFQVPARYRSSTGLLALDDSGQKDQLWFCGFVWGSYNLYRIEDTGSELKLLDRPMEKLGGRDPKMSLPFSDQVSVVGNKVLSGHPGFGQRTAVYYRAFDAETGKPAGLYYPRVTPDKNPKFGHLAYGDTRGGSDGLFYIYTGSVVRRFDGKGTLVPFGKDGPDAIGRRKKTRAGDLSILHTGHPHTRSSGLFITPRGEVYLTTMPLYLKDPKKKHNWTWAGIFVRKFASDGTLAPDPLITTKVARLAGLAVDSRGNIYVGAQAIEGSQRTPESFRKAFPADLTKQARHMYELCGSILKFPPEGGEIVADDNGAYTAGWMRSGKKANIKNSIWLRRGGLIPAKNDLGCYCETSRFDIDPFDRLFVPDPLTFSVRVLDTAGNQVMRFGCFGNMDCRGPGSQIPQPEVTFGWPTQVDCALGRAYVVDLVNRRIVSVRFEHAVSAESDL